MQLSAEIIQFLDEKVAQLEQGNKEDESRKILYHLIGHMTSTIERERQQIELLSAAVKKLGQQLEHSA